MVSNITNEKFFINLVKNKTLTLTLDGKVYNNRTKRYIGYKTNSGYIGIGFKDKKKSRKILVHRLMWLIYKNENLKSNIQINHKDCDKTHNTLDNLEEVTNSENVRHAYKNGLIRVNTKKRIEARKNQGIIYSGEKCSSAKLTNKQALEIRNLYKTADISQREIAKQFNVSRECIKDVVTFRSFKFI